jgi:predicted lipid-binding transport protein (Tim44 family)
MFDDMGSRGSHGSAVRPVSDRTQPSPAPVTAPPAPPRPKRWIDGWRPTAVGFVAGGLLGGLLCGFGHGLIGMNLVLAGGFALLMFLRLRRAVAAPPRVPADPPSGVGTPSGGAAAAHPRDESSFARGLRDIQQTDPGFDPSRFAGYAAMMFRDTQSAWTARDVGPLHERVTPEMYDQLQARSERLRSTGRTNRVEQTEITTAITEAWQESGRDYVTAYVSGSILDYTIDEASHGLVAGSRTTPRPVEEFWTFTRPAGLNFWMLSAIQTS